MTQHNKPAMPPFMQSLAAELASSSDVLHVPLEYKEASAHLLYIKSVVDGTVLQQTILKPFFELGDTGKFAAYVAGLPNSIELPDTEDILNLLTQGFVLTYASEQYSLLEIRKLFNTQPSETFLETTIHGSQIALSEDLETSINIIRQHYHQPNLKVETMQLTDKSHRSIALLYDGKDVNGSVLRRVKERLNELDAPLIQSAGDLSIQLTKRKLIDFPTFILTERPDRIVYNISGGKVIILVDHSPIAIILPVAFFDFMVSMEENYHTYLVSLFNTLLGWFGLFTCLLLPALYVAFSAYIPEVLRTELTLSIAGSRIGVPYPAFLEAIIMVIFVELLTEASIRLPRSINATATTVGGLILGTAATEAALASNILIIIVAIVAISTFVIPINELSFVVRLWRLLLIILTSLFGPMGLTAGFSMLVIHLVSLESFGQPFLRVAWRNKRDEKKVDP